MNNIIRFSTIVSSALSQSTRLLLLVDDQIDQNRLHWRVITSFTRTPSFMSFLKLYNTPSIKSYYSLNLQIYMVPNEVLAFKIVILQKVSISLQNI